MNEAVRQDIAAVLGPVGDARSIGGGCISPAFRVELAGGAAFVKTAAGRWPADAFAEEARSLNRLRQAGGLVPRVLAVTEAWLALEWLEPGPADRSGWSALGRTLARLHRSTGPGYGWDADNYIGPLRQCNRAAGAGTWADFWRERRLLPLLEAAEPALDHGTRRDFERLLDQLDERLGDGDCAALLHGDLWSGNVHFCTAGAALIDPACWFGDREVDLAMAELFGGFPREFFAAYAAEWPLRAGSDGRRPIYQLYYLLVHVVLFGASYADATARTLAAALRR